jgi:hypothetical protein
MPVLVVIVAAVAFMLSNFQPPLYCMSIMVDINAENVYTHCHGCLTISEIFHDGCHGFNTASCASYSGCKIALVILSTCFLMQISAQEIMIVQPDPLILCQVSTLVTI